MAILLTRCKPGNFASCKSAKLNNIRDLRSNLVECESFLESNSAERLALRETNLDDSISFCQFSRDGKYFFNLKRFYYSCT